MQRTPRRTSARLLLDGPTRVPPPASFATNSPSTAPRRSHAERTVPGWRSARKPAPSELFVGLPTFRFFGHGYAKTGHERWDDAVARCRAKEVLSLAAALRLRPIAQSQLIRGEHGTILQLKSTLRHASRSPCRARA